MSLVLAGSRTSIASPLRAATLAAAAIAAAALLSTAPARAAQPCSSADDCPAKFCVDGFCCDTACNAPCEACSSAKKGGGADGTCGFMPRGAVCEEAHCDGDALAFVDTSVCDDAHQCVAPTPVPCVHDNPCALDLCADTGCEIVLKLDGTPCAADMECNDGICGPIAPTSSSSSAGSGGSGGAGAAPAGGAGGAVGGGGSSTSSGDPYPPIHETGCGCGTAGNSPMGGALSVALAALALLRRRRVSPRA